MNNHQDDRVKIDIQYEKNVDDPSRGRPEGSLFDSYYTEV